MKNLLNVFFILLPCFVFAQNTHNNEGIIKGYLTTTDDRPAKYVSILLINSKKSTTTDQNGNFELSKIKPGTYTLSFSLSEVTFGDTLIQVAPNETILLKIKLQSTFVELEEVIVRANSKYVETKPSQALRLNLPLIEVPQNIIVISHQLLSDQGLVSMTQAIRTVSGVEKSYGELNDYSLIIRGTDATYNVFRNGVGGYWWNQQEDVAMLERIEFVKGPASFMVSLAEPGGILNNVTKQPTKERMASVNAAFGSFNLMRVTTDLGGTVTKSGKLYYHFVAGIHSQKRDFKFGKAVRYFICPSLTYELNKKTSLTAEYNYMYGKTSGNNNGLPAVDGRMFVLPRDFAIADPATDAITGIDNYYRLHLKHDFNDHWHLNVQVAVVYGPWGGYRLWSDDVVPITNDTIYRISSYDHYTNYTNTAQAFIDGKFRTSRKIEHKVLFGVDYNNGGSKGYSGGTSGEKKFGLYIPNPDYYINPDSLRNFEINWVGHERTRWIALYFQDHIKIAGHLIVTLAGHLTHASQSWEGVDWIPPDDKKIIDNVFTPRAGLTWLFGSNISAYALYDQCFLPQSGRSFDEKRFKPVRGYNIETGMKGYFFDKKLTLNVSVFDIVKDNMLSDDPVHIGDQIQTGQVVSKGIDFDMTGHIVPSLTINANYEYADAKVTKESNPTSIGIRNYLTPDHRANLWLQYTQLRGDFKGLAFSAGYQYTGKRGAVWYFQDPDKTKVLPAYSLFDAGLSYSREKFKISLNMYNITNKNYASIGYYNPTGGWKYTPGEPINFLLSLDVNLHYKKPIVEDISKE